MKAKELMIGDWVHYSMNLGPDGIYEKNMQISNIYGFEVDCEIRDYTIIGGRRMSDLSPIPLTSEILEKNGWFEIWKDAWEGDIALSKEKDSFRIKNTNICLRYVHELQRALRLCGLNKLADGFTV